MFTGLIREMAEVDSFSNNILTVKANYNPNIGDSIAINGACLTVINTQKDGFCVELSPESQSLLAMENFTGRIHMEPAMMMGDRFEGHIVQGHVDCIGTIANIIQNGNSTDFFITIPKEYMKFVQTVQDMRIKDLILSPHSHKYTKPDVCHSREFTNLTTQKHITCILIPLLLQLKW